MPIPAFAAAALTGAATGGGGGGTSLSVSTTAKSGLKNSPVSNGSGVFNYNRPKSNNQLVMAAGVLALGLFAVKKWG